MRTILISGASRGIGLNIAHKELKEGNRISVGIRDLESLKGSAIDPNKWPKGKIIINHYDALKKITAENWIKNTLDEFGGFDSVINCSGVFSKVPFLYKDGDEVDILSTNKSVYGYLAIGGQIDLKYQKSIDTVIGKDYPEPIVIHEEARKKALDAFKSLKKN